MGELGLDQLDIFIKDLKDGIECTFIKYTHGTKLEDRIKIQDDFDAFKNISWMKL